MDVGARAPWSSGAGTLVDVRLQLLAVGRVPMGKGRDRLSLLTSLCRAPPPFPAWDCGCSGACHHGNQLGQRPTRVSPSGDAGQVLLRWSPPQLGI